MTSRNKLALSPVPTAGNSGGGAGINSRTKDYLDAVSVLNEDLMNHACELLLLDQHDDDNENGNEMEEGSNRLLSVEDQLLEMYGKCEDALKVIRKHQHQPSSGVATQHGTVLPVGVLGAPNLNGPMPAPRMAPRGSLPKLMNMNKIPGLVGNSKQGVVPIRRTALNKPGINLHNKTQQQQQQQQQQHQQLRRTGSNISNSGDNHPTIAVSSLEKFNNKRQRLSPPPPNPESDPTAPPPSALDFLARLNKETPSNNTSKVTTTDPSSITNESKGTSISTNSNTKSGRDASNMETQQQSDPPKRKNPPRGLQKPPPPT